MEIVATNLSRVMLIKPDVFEDHRGEYCETYNEGLYRRMGVDVRFVQDDISVSSCGVLRGIHCDNKCWKLVSCMFGRFYLVIVNGDAASPGFGQWQAFTLTDRNRHQVLVPPLHGVAHLALSEKIIFHYKQSEDYDPARQATFLWNDPRFGIWWPIKTPILSKRDETGRYVS